MMLCILDACVNVAAHLSLFIRKNLNKRKFLFFSVVPFCDMSALAPIRIAANFPLKIVGKTRFSTAHVLVTKEKSPLKYT